MTEAPDDQQQTPGQLAQTTPLGTRSFDEMNTGQMVFELQGTIHEIKASIAALGVSVEHGFHRLEGIERTSGEIKEALRLLTPKIDDLVGFTKHRAPDLASKADVVKNCRLISN